MNLRETWKGGREEQELCKLSTVYKILQKMIFLKFPSLLKPMLLSKVSVSVQLLLGSWPPDNPTATLLEFRF